MAIPSEKLLERRYSIEEYLELVDKTEGKYEYHDGKLVDWRAMAGAAEPHALISANFIRRLGNALEDKPCRVYSSDLILRIQRKAKYRFGDAAVICGPTVFDPDDKSRAKAVLNPTVIAEVLSETSEGDDRGDKFRDYREIETFREYVLISQTKPLIETFYKQDDGAWVFADFKGLDARVQLRSLSLWIALADIYANVTFPAVTDMPYDPRVSN
jgi:Uma2 family endonuclease